MTSMNTNLLKIFMREIVAALGALSLILLAIAHQPIDGGGRDIYLLADGSLPVICGLSLDETGDSTLSVGCDACRISTGVALPPAPCTAEKLFWANQPVEFSSPVVLNSVVNFGRARFARGPPVIV